MRIESGQRVATVSLRSAGRAASGVGPFSVTAEPTGVRAGVTESAGPVASLDALLALQAVDDPLFRRRKAVRRGRSLLDALELLRGDLLSGPIGDGRLNQLLALIGQAREQSVPELDALVDEIEVRVHVELAKHGRFATP